ncbi:MAG: sensor histidine kinase [Verrucomicrobiia bacterium]
MIRKTVGRKLMVAVDITVLLIISVFAYVNIRSHTHNLRAEVERHAIQVSQTVKSSTEYDMLLNEPERIHQTIRRLGQEKSIERIRIMNKAGEITYSSDTNEIGKTVDLGAESCVLCHSVEPPLERLEKKARTRVFQRPGERSGVLGVITPIYNQPSCWSASCHAHPRSKTVLGVYDVIMPLAAVDEDIRRGRIEILIFAASAVVALSLITGVFVRRWVSVPVEKLVAATHHIAGGDLSGTIDETRQDELGMLARSFNQMTRKLSEARLQLVQSDKMISLGRLAAGVAHEINNPLTGVLTYSSLMLKNARTREEQDDLKVIVRETIRCRDIVKSLLDFARQSVPRKRESDINEVIQQALSVVERQLSLKGVVVEKDLHPNLPHPVVDANQMQQVFVNLIVNAADAIGPEGGTITLRTSAISLSPVGVLQIKQAVCPKRHSLIDSEVRFDGKPSIRLKARCEDQEGWVYIDSVYGKAGNRRGFSFDDRRKAQFVCAECSTSLMVEGRVCPRCAAAVLTFEAPPKGLVEICTRRECGWQRWEDVDASGSRDYIEIQVRDTGCGIPAEQIPKIYEPFHSTKGAKGIGLGLAVVWGIIDSHDGSITVESGIGKGTTFTVRIPAKP